MSDRIQAPRSEGVGLRIPERRSDCTGRRPSWYPFVINTDEECEGVDWTDPLPTERHREVPASPGLPDWHP